MTESLHGLRLSRFYNYEQDVYIPAPTGGWNPDANQWELPIDQAPTLDNFIIKPGKIVGRQSLQKRGNLTTVGNPFQPCGWVIGEGGSVSSAGLVNLWRKANSITAVIDPWNAPLLNAPAASLAAGVLSSIQVDVNPTSIVSAVPASADHIGGPRWINFDGLLYGISYDSAGAVVTDTNATYHMKPLSLLTLPVIQTGGAVPASTVLANAPHGMFDLKGYLSRIWLLGGIDTPGGLAVHEPTTLYYTNPGASGVGTASADWKDPVSGLVNKIRMDQNTADYGVGLGLVSNAMVIFRRSSVWVLRGTTSQSFQLQLISREVGCIDARSIVETDHGIYFMSAKGLMLTDGVTVVLVSGNVTNELTAAVLFQQQAILSGTPLFSGWVSAAQTSQGHILISIGTYIVSGSTTMNAIWSGMFDPRLNVWTRITSGLFNAGSGGSLPGLLFGTQARERLFSVDDTSLVQMENYATANPLNSPSFLVPYKGEQGGSDVDVTASPFAYPVIPFKWQSKLVPMSTGTRKRIHMKRYFFDYTFNSNPNGNGTSGWTIQPFDVETLTSLDAAQTPGTSGAALAGSIALKPNPAVSRFNHDIASESRDMYFVVTYNESNFGTTGILDVVAEIYGIGLEFQHTRDAR